MKLFSRIMRKDPDGQISLVTPYEKVIVHVEDAPFVAVRVDRAGEPGAAAAFAIADGRADVALAGVEQPILVEIDPDSHEPSPYVLVRGGLEAKLSRPVFYELADMAEAFEGAAGQLGVWSQGQFFELGPAA